MKKTTFVFPIFKIGSRVFQIGKWEKGMIRETSGLKYNIKKN